MMHRSASGRRSRAPTVSLRTTRHHGAIAATISQYWATSPVKKAESHPADDSRVDPPEVLQRIREGLTLVQDVARLVTRELGGAVDFDELVSAGNEALVDVARRYNPAIGASFKVFAKARLKGAMKDAHREQSGLPPRRLYERLTAESLGGGDESTAANRKRLLARHLAGVAAAQEGGVVGHRGLDTQGEVLAISPRSTAEHQSHRQQVIAQCLAQLSPQEATLFQRLYFDDEGLERVAAEIGVSKSWASRLHDRALSRLKKALK
jgi:RNA polymerase sigma factor FliA